MRLLVVLAFVLVALGTASSEMDYDKPPSEVCLVCSGIVPIPETDSEAQILLKFACDSIENSLGAGACRTLASAIHKTNTWPVFKWVLEKIKGPTCAVICPK